MFDYSDQYPKNTSEQIKNIRTITVRDRALNSLENSYSDNQMQEFMNFRPGSSTGFQTGSLNSDTMFKVVEEKGKESNYSNTLEATQNLDYVGNSGFTYSKRQLKPKDASNLLTNRKQLKQQHSGRIHSACGM